MACATESIDSTDPDQATGGSTTTGGAVGSGGSVTGGAVGSGGAATGGASASGGVTAIGGSGGVTVHPTCPGNAADAYQGTARVIPGTVQAEDFDPAGYSDTTEDNEGGAYRTDVGVDIKMLGDGYTVGWTIAGEWLEYTVDVPIEGDFEVTLRVAAVEAGRTLDLSQCGTSLTGPIAVPQVADWGELATTTVNVHLAAGVQVLRVTVGDSDYVDFDSMSFAPATAGTGGATGTGGAYTGGATGTGGAATGGTNTGGAATGGASTGGAATGGSSTGGAATGGSSGTLPKFVGNITTGNSIDTGGRVFAKYWDQITPENAGKWGSVQSSATSSMNWSALDGIYDYAQAKGIIFKQHTFVWGSQQPSGNLTEAQVKSWIQTFCQRYPNTKIIDVVNEPPPHTTPSYANAIGGGTNGSWQWIINAFTWAHQSCPNAILVLNDYNNIEYGDQNQHFIDIAKAVKNAGAPIHALGAQSHGLSGNVSTNTMKNLLTKMHNDTGLPVYITEYDIDLNDDNAQLNKYKEHFAFFLDTDWIPGITIWGWIHGSTWVPNSGLIRNGTPRPAMTWLMQELGRPAP